MVTISVTAMPLPQLKPVVYWGCSGVGRRVLIISWQKREKFRSGLQMFYHDILVLAKIGCCYITALLRIGLWDRGKRNPPSGQICK